MGRGAKGAAWCSLAPLLFALAPLACLDLPDLSRESCGDGFLDEERGEDCDGEARTIDGKDYECERDQCRLKCDPASVHACSATSFSAAASAAGCCPPGWGCGVDGLCSERSDELLRGIAVDADVSRLLTADFDGDGLEDILSIGASDLAVHHFEEDEIVEALRLSLSSQATAIGDIAQGEPGARAQVDLALTVGAGVGVLRGGAEHEFTPLIYPIPLVQGGSELVMAGARMVAADHDVTDQDPSEDFVFVSDTHVAPVATGAFQELPGKAALEGGIAVGDVNRDNDCEEIVLPVVINDLLHVYLHSPCGPDWSKVAQLLGARKLVGSVQVLDIDKDGSLEVAVGEIDNDYNIRILVLRYQGGALESGPTVVTKELEEDQLCAGGSTPLAIGDLDGDCLPDYVDPCQIVISGAEIPPGASCAPDEGERQDIVYFNTEAPWSAALIRDFNGDGKPDVVAASESSAGLSFFSGTGAALLNPSSLPARVEVGQIVAGDFDGDSITDVGILENSLNKPDSTVLIAFGQHLGTPEVPLKLGEVRHAAQLLVGDYTLVSPTIDGMSDLGVLSVPRSEAMSPGVESGGSANLTLFAGHAKRRMQSAVYLTDDPTRGGEQPKQIALGRFGPKQEMEIAALALVPGPPPWARIWRIPFGSGGEATIPLDRPDVLRNEDGEALDGLIAVTTQITAIHSPSSLDKLVLVSSEDLINLAAPSQLRLLSAASSTLWSVELGPLDLPGRLAPGGLVAEDLDQDGWDDLSLLLDVGGDTEPQAREVYVLWNGPEGLSLQRMTRIVGCSPGEPAAPVSGLSGVSGVAWADAESGEARSGILVSGGAVCRLEFRAEPQCDPAWVGTFGICRQEPFITPLIIDGVSSQAMSGTGPTGGPPLVPGSAMAMGDVNGDGLLDLVAGEAASFRVFLARAKEP